MERVVAGDRPRVLDVGLGAAHLVAAPRLEQLAQVVAPGRVQGDGEVARQRGVRDVAELGPARERELLGGRAVHRGVQRPEAQGRELPAVDRARDVAHQLP